MIISPGTKPSLIGHDRLFVKEIEMNQAQRFSATADMTFRDTRLGNYIVNSYEREELTKLSQDPNGPFKTPADLPNAFIVLDDGCGTSKYLYLNLQRARFERNGDPIMTPNKRTARTEEIVRVIREIQERADFSNWYILDQDQLSGRFILGISPRDRSRFVGNVITATGNDRNIAFRGSLLGRLDFRACLEEDDVDTTTYCYKGGFDFEIAPGKKVKYVCTVKPYVSAMLEDLSLPGELVQAWLLSAFKENFPFIFDHKLISNFSLKLERKIKLDDKK